MKIVWLAPFPLQHLEAQLPICRSVGFGTGAWLVNLSQVLAQQPGVELHVITHSIAVTRTTTLQTSSFTLHVLRYSLPFVNKGYPDFFRWDILSWYRGFVNEARVLIAKINPNVVHAHGTEGPYSLVASHSNRPAITSIQGIIEQYTQVENTPWFRLQVPIERYCIQHNQHFGCRTNWDEQYVLSVNPKATIHYMPEAINPVFFEHNWAEPDFPTILFVGKLSARKGIDTLIEALALLKPQWQPKLWIVGKGEINFIAHLKERIKQYDLDQQVEFLGGKTSVEIAALLQKATVYVLPTLMDNSPNSLCEAMAVGTPAIASAVGGVPTLINHEQTGLLTESGNASALADSLHQLLSNTTLQTLLSEQSRQIAYQRNHPINVTKQTLNVYRALLL